jgi:hypothetical protein
MYELGMKRMILPTSHKNCCKTDIRGLCNVCDFGRFSQPLCQNKSAIFLKINETICPFLRQFKKNNNIGPGQKPTGAKLFRQQRVNGETVDGDVLRGRQQVEREEQRRQRRQIAQRDESATLRASNGAPRVKMKTKI